jgi:hypothetical protein
VKKYTAGRQGSVDGFYNAQVMNQVYYYFKLFMEYSFVLIQNEPTLLQAGRIIKAE